MIRPLLAAAGVLTIAQASQASWPAVRRTVRPCCRPDTVTALIWTGFTAWQAWMPWTAPTHRARRSCPP